MFCQVDAATDRRKKVMMATWRMVYSVFEERKHARVNDRTTPVFQPIYS